MAKTKKKVENQQQTQMLFIRVQPVGYCLIHVF